MDIDSEISKKIQSAIKAKLVEINAYVDDELPDYIMIMIANRKAEDQMSESLSLFLGDNAKVFTKWLYQLLATLVKQQDKTETKTVPTEVKAGKPQTNVVVEDGSAKKSQSNKQNRWDVQSPSEEMKKEPTVESENKKTAPEVPKEAVIDILPDINDLFHDEILTANEAASRVAPKKTESSLKTKSEKPLPKTISTDKEAKHKEVSATENKKDVKSHGNKKKTDKKSNDSKRKSGEDHPSQSEAVASKVSSSNHSKKSSHKRGVSIKVSKTSSEKLSTSDKEYSDAKRKKCDRSSDKESSHKHKTAKSSHTRDWDKNKGHEHISYRESYHKSRRSSGNKSSRIEEDDDDIVSNKRIRSQVSSSVSSVVKTSVYVSEDDSDDDRHPSSSKVISKVAIPERRSRLAPSKQANRSLLLKAVSEAESSIKKHRQANKIIEPISEKAFKTRVEQHKKLAVTSFPERIKSSQRKETSVSNVSSKLLRQTNLLHASGNETTESKYPPKKFTIVKHKSSENENVNKLPSEVGNLITSEEDSEMSNVVKTAQIPEENVEYPKKFGDTRLIVSRDEKPTATKLKKSLAQSLPDIAPSVQFDSRKLLLKKLPEKEDVSVKKISLKKTKASVDESNQNNTQLKRAKKNRSPSPCFIVTLDGTSTFQQSKKLPNKESKKVPFQPIPVQAPGTDVDGTKPSEDTAKSAVQPDTKKEKTSPEPNSSNITKSTNDDHTSDLELSNMREQLIKMQEEARKLKEKQSKQQEIVKKKNVIDQTITKPDNRSIHIANVHFSATEKQLTEHFSICGKVLRVTILKDPFTNHPKGFAYLEFEEENSVGMAVALDGTSFCGRNISVSRKENEAVSNTTYSFKHFYAPKRQRYTSSRLIGRYKTRVSSARSWTRNMVTRNKTWVKPGYIPS